MALVLDGTNGITSSGDITINNGAADGGQVILSSSGYSNWNLDNYSGRFRAYYNATEYFTIDTSGNVGIGPGSPDNKLEVALSDNQGINLEQTGASQTGYINWRDSDGTLSGRISYDHATDALRFATNISERMRIDSSGNVGIGITSFATIAPLTVATASINANYGQITSYSITSGDVARTGMSVVKYDNNTTTSQILFKFLINQGANGSGQINANGANACAFGTYSDARLKENIEPLLSQLDNILALKPSEFDYIESEGGGRQIGFIAQEMQEVYPDAVGKREDGMLTISGWDKTAARLVKAIQELSAKVEEQAKRIELLESK